MGLYPHQELTVNLIMREKRAAVWLEMRLGKTLCTIEAAKRLDSKRFLVVVPNYLKGTWRDEFQKWSPGTAVEIVDAAGRERALKSETWPKVINYEGFRIDYKLIKSLKPDMVVFDESHYLKGRTARVTKCAWDLGKYTDTRIVLMTGTPIGNHFSDYYAQYKILRPDLFPTFTQFKYDYLHMGGYMGYEEIEHHKNPEVQKLIDDKHAKINAKIDSFTIRLKKSDCIKDLPPKLYQTIEAEMPDELRVKYQTMAKEAVMELENAKAITADMIVTRLMRLQQICSGWIGHFADNDPEHKKPLVHEICASPKLAPLIEKISNDNQQCLIWAHFKHDIKNIVEALTKAKISVATINGSVCENDREIAKRDFQQGKLMCLVIQDSIVAGMDLSKATVVHFYQNSYSHLQRTQAEDRCQSMTQKNSVIYYDWITKNSIEERILQKLRDKKNLAAIVDKNELRDIFLGGK